LKSDKGYRLRPFAFDEVRDSMVEEAGREALLEGMAKRMCPSAERVRERRFQSCMYCQYLEFIGG